MNSTWLVGTLIGALIVAAGSIAVAITRFANKSPEQREADTAEFNAVTTGFTAVNTGLAADYARVRGELTAFRAWAFAAIATLRAFIRSLGHEPPDIGPEP